MIGHRDVGFSEKVWMDVWVICVAVRTEAPGFIHSLRRGNWLKGGADQSSGL